MQGLRELGGALLVSISPAVDIPQGTPIYRSLVLNLTVAVAHANKRWECAPAVIKLAKEAAVARSVPARIPIVTHAELRAN